jgi:hypothetical protein
MNDNLVKENTIPVESIIKKENYYLLAGTIFLGILANILFYNKPLGVSYTIFVFAFLGVFILNLNKSIKFEISFGWILSIPIFFLSATYFIFSNGLFGLLNFLGIPILIIAQTILITRKNCYKWYKFMFIGDLLYGFFVRVFVKIGKPFKLVFQTLVLRTNIKKHGNVYKVFIGLGISLPLVFIVIFLLSSADKVFENFIGKISDLFIDVNIEEFIVRLIFIVIITICSFSYIWSLNTSNKDTETVIEDKVFTKKILDPVIVVTILAVVNIIYVFFTLIQFAYLFGGISFDHPQNFSYSEYARRGFFELIIVTLINLSILLMNMNLTKLAGSLLNRIVRILNSLLIICTLIMLISAHLRIYLYENTYGYTYLRVLTHAFMVFIFILLAATFYKVWNERVSLLKSYIIIALFSYVIINFANIDVIIAENNIKRYQITGKIDVPYLSSLSYDAVPTLVTLINDKDKSVSLQIQNYLYYKREQLMKKSYWQSYNISQDNARKALLGLKLYHEPERKV